MELTKAEQKFLLDVLIQLQWKTEQAESATTAKQIALKLQESLQEKPVEAEVV